jgi:hypothetical protein
MEKTSWTELVRNEEVLHRVKEEKNVLHTIKRGRDNWNGQILRMNCFLNTLLKGR